MAVEAKKWCSKRHCRAKNRHKQILHVKNEHRLYILRFFVMSEQAGSIVIKNRPEDSVSNSHNMPHKQLNRLKYREMRRDYSYRQV